MSRGSMSPRMICRFCDFRHCSFSYRHMTWLLQWPLDAGGMVNVWNIKYLTFIDILRPNWLRSFKMNPIITEFFQGIASLCLRFRKFDNAKLR